MMTDRAAQLELDLEATAMLLCKEMATASDRERLLHTTRQHCEGQQDLCFRALSENANLRWRLQQQQQQLAASQQELDQTKVWNDRISHTFTANCTCTYAIGWTMHVGDPVHRNV